MKTQVGFIVVGDIHHQNMHFCPPLDFILLSAKFHVARVCEERGVYRVLLGKPEGRNHSGDLDIEG